MTQNPEEPATTKGTTAPAGAGSSDAELTDEVAAQTDPNLLVEGIFEREREHDGTTTDAPAASIPADDLG